jgi:hypothetical protein
LFPVLKHAIISTYKRASEVESLCKESLIMKNILFKSILFFSMCLGLAFSVSGQSSPEEFKKKVDAIVAQAYQEAVVKFPCRLRTSGKAKMGRLKDVENCVNPAHDLVDWEGHAAALRKLREDERISREDLAAAVETALTEQALPYHRIFQVKEKEEGAALLPLTNSILKFLPENSLTALPVYRKDGSLLGSFIGTYSFDRSGGLEILTGYNMKYFQYTDLHGSAQAPGERFLIDSYGVPWRDAWHRPGFRLPPNKLLN